MTADLTSLTGIEVPTGLLIGGEWRPGSAGTLGVTDPATEDTLVEIANGTRYGLQAAVFTRSIDVALHLARRIETGGLMVNEGSNFRIDQMPFGGVKDSGIGREGVRYAVREFIEPRLVAIALGDPD